MARKGRARRFREARELKQRDDGLFREGGGTLADLESTNLAESDVDDSLDDADDVDDPWADVAAVHAEGLED